MPNDTPLTPEVAAVVAAFDLAMDIDDSTGLFERSRNALAAALRELADQLRNFPIESRKEVWEERVKIHNRITAIAENIERAVTYAPTDNPANEA